MRILDLPLSTMFTSTRDFLTHLKNHETHLETSFLFPKIASGEFSLSHLRNQEINRIEIPTLYWLMVSNEKLSVQHTYLKASLYIALTFIFRLSCFKTTAPQSCQFPIWEECIECTHECNLQENSIRWPIGSVLFCLGLIIIIYVTGSNHRYCSWRFILPDC